MIAKLTVADGTRHAQGDGASAESVTLSNGRRSCRDDSARTFAIEPKAAIRVIVLQGNAAFGPACMIPKVADFSDKIMHQNEGKSA